MPKHYRKNRKRRNKSMKSQVYRNKKQLKDIARGIEHKFFDSARTADGMDTTGATFLVNGVRLGDSVSNREGNKLLAKRLTLRGQLLNINGTPADTVVRVVVFRARSQNNADQTIALLTQNGPTNVDTMMRQEHYKRYQILADKTFAMDTAAHSIIPFYFTHKCNSVCTYSADTGASTDLEDGAYYVGYWGSSAAGANAPTIIFTSRFYYTDA